MRKTVRIAAFLGCFGLLIAQAQAEQWRFSDVDRVVAVSDIHGAFDAMTATFRSAGIVDDDLTWAAGPTHLVITGDLLDRGPDSRLVMDFIMRLEREAENAGGRVHQLIGNHEAMNLIGDLRYVAIREYAAFETEESSDERERWFERFVSRAAPETDEASLRATFEKLAPPGFFAHRRAFRAGGHYGKWLLSKPLMVVINDTAFVHGGLSPYVAEHGLEGVNGALKSELARYVSQLAILEDAGLLHPTDNFRDHPALLKAAAETIGIESEMRPVIDAAVELNGSAIHDPEGPLWYRGSARCGELIEGDALQDALERIGANRVVIGHTPTFTRSVLQRMSGRVIEIDTGMLSSHYQGSGNALLIEGDSLTVIKQDGSTNSPPVQHPRRVGLRAASIDAHRLGEILANGSIVDANGNANADESGRTLVTVSHDDATVMAYFDEQPRKKGFVPELAAYRLDRLLGLDMVPVTVSRELDGRQGTLQFVPEPVKSEEERAATGLGGSAWCDLPLQWNSMYLFDALIHNRGRTPALMLYSPENWQLMLVHHSGAFGNQKGRPAYLKNIELNIGDEWLAALNELNDDVLRETLADVLPKRQLSALAKRRDALIEDAVK